MNDNTAIRPLRPVSPMSDEEKFAQDLRCTSVDDVRSTIALLDPSTFAITAVKLAAEQCEDFNQRGYAQKTKAKMLRAWLKRAAKLRGGVV